MKDKGMFATYKCRIQIASIVAMAVILVSCTSQELGAVPTTSTPSALSQTTAPPISVVHTPKPSVVPVQLVTSTPLPTIIPTSTPITQPPSTEEWLAYVGADGASIQYPAGWHVVNATYTSIVRFESLVDTVVNPNYVIYFDVFAVPLEQRSMADPYTWQPNEGGYAVQWGKPISIAGASGVEFIWGCYEENGQWDALPSLYAIYYSERHELMIWIFTHLDDRSLELIEAMGFSGTVSSRFGVFEHMVESVRILE
jgi:hypothetical protein